MAPVFDRDDRGTAVRGLASWALLTTLIACGASTAPTTPSVAATPALDSDPPLSAIAAQSERLPAPIAAWATLNDPEHHVVSDQLLARARELSSEPVEIHETATGLELCVKGEAERMATELRKELAEPNDLIVTSNCRSFTPLSRIGTNEVRAEFVSQEAIDLNRVWSALLAELPTACEVEVDSSASPAKSGGLSRSVETLPRRLPVTAAFKGFVLKEQLVLRLQDRSTLDGGASGQGLYLALESNLYWRRASSSTWTKVHTLEELTPGMVETVARNARARCGQLLLKKVVK